MFNQTQLRELFTYNPNTGDFLWKITGKNAGTAIHSKEKIPTGTVVQINEHKYMIGPLIWTWVYNYWPNTPHEVIDHINRDPLDNRLVNLRLVTFKQNVWNSSRRKDNTSGHTGVRFDKWQGKYQAYINVNSKRMHLGFFWTKEEAIEAREKAKAKYHSIA